MEPVGSSSSIGSGEDIARPVTRATARLRSVSLDRVPKIRVTTRPVNITTPPPGGVAEDHPANPAVNPADPEPQRRPDPEENVHHHDVPHVDAPANPPHQPPIIPPPQTGQDQLQREIARIRREGRFVMMEAQNFIEAHEQMVLSNETIIRHIKDEYHRILDAVSACMTKTWDHECLDQLSEDLERCMRTLQRFLTIKMEHVEVRSTARPPMFNAYQREDRRQREASPESMEMFQRDVEFFMSRLHEDIMPDVGMGAPVTNDLLRELYDVTLPQVNQAITDCRQALKVFTSHSNYDRNLAREAQERCEDATRWVSDLMHRYRQHKLHLDKNTKHKEITFTTFKSGGEVSIYEFMSKFESWADGYISEDAKADLLYNKYLDKSIVESYSELSPIKEDFHAMKAWLIKKFGSVVPMANGYVKAISRLPTPKASDLPGMVKYLRSIHRLLTSLSELEITKGVPVPKLQSHLASNAFLSSLVTVLPYRVRSELIKHLIRKDIDDLDSIEGREHFDAILKIVKEKYREAELESTACPTSSGGSSSQPAKQVPASSTKTQPKQVNVASTYSTNVQQPAVQQQSAPLPPFLTGGNAVPITTPRQNNQNQSSWSPQQNANPSGYKFNRWTCPIRSHRNHDVQTCNMFWSSSPQERRDSCRFGGCYTCLSKFRDCKGGPCAHIDEVPAELICPDCAQSTKPGNTPPSVLMCGINQHRKPQLNDLTMSLEAWIPNLDLNQYSSSLRVNLAHIGVFKTAVGSPPPISTKTSPPTCEPSNIVYDTHSGKYKPLSPTHQVVKQVKESAFFLMQTIKIKHEEILVFYDSGANSHLIEGELAEELNLDVVSNESIPIEALGNKTVWSNYGSYSITIGADIYGEYHELELQGIDVITSSFPEIDLTEIWDEANTALRGCRMLPKKIGGARARILIGMKATQLSPKLTHTLPSGLGIYESVLVDIYNSNICFGGPHKIFSQAYEGLGKSAAHAQAMFTEMAQAYLSAPKTFVRVSVEDHGPPLDLSRELDLVEEFKKSFPVSKSPESESLPSLFSESDSPSEIFHSGEHGPLSDSDDCAIDHKEDVQPDPSDDESLHSPDVVLQQQLHCEHLMCAKSLIPLSKLKGLQDEIDIPDIVEFRCDTCANCPTCRISARAKTKSLQESFEQEIIEKSVHVDLEKATVFVDLPFIKDPVKFLSKKHGGCDNYNQAYKVYQAQCRKRDDVKDQVKKAHAELVDKGYMVPFESLPETTQKMIQDAPFRHYYPWRAVYKEDSVTTPVRLVVDPTMTGLNEILAKGTNMLSKIPELLINFRTARFAWNTDISKLYNQLHLNLSALPYSLFLFHSELDPKIKPMVWVMVRAWYGVSSTGNQSGVALEYLANKFKEEFPAAHLPLTKMRYVDDILAGAQSAEARDEQIRQVQECLKAGGFTMKYIAKSGEKPPVKASANGRTVGCLGLSWDTKEDTIQLAFDEDFFIKKLRGQKAVLDLNLKDPASLNKALTQDLLTRAGILSRVAELYDPCGWWEPIKVQMKLAMQAFNSLDWKAPIPEHSRDEWQKLFILMNQVKEICIPRSVIPEEKMLDVPGRIITLADAANHACGCAVYVGFAKSDGTFTCDLILAKSKMVHGTIPRNELEGMVLAAESSLFVYQVLKEMVHPPRIYTDSRIVLCWVLNKSKRLRMWAFNRVQAIHNMMKQQNGDLESTPIYHISGLENLADMLTKPKSLKSCEMQSSSAWHKGLDWMILPTEDLPSEQVSQPDDDVKEDFNKEIFQEIELSQVATDRGDRVFLTCLGQTLANAKTPAPPVVCMATTARNNCWLLSTFKFVQRGWSRAWNLLRLVIKAVELFKHNVHRAHLSSGRFCFKCRVTPSLLNQRTDFIINKNASEEAEAKLTFKTLNAKHHLHNGVWYSSSRLIKEGQIETKDLDCVPFFDSQNIKKLLPVVLVQSEIFHSYLAFVHLVEMPHRGVESTFRRIRERFYPIGQARFAITLFRKHCSKCLIQLKETIALELADFPQARTTVAPPFWAVQIDIAMSFKAKLSATSKKTVPCSALVVVCLLTSATSILAMEGISTQAVIQALERHSYRYGTPAHMFVDAGTQLEKLQDASFQLKDVHLRSGTQRFNITVATPKAHHQQGRVEAKIREMRKMLAAWATSTEECNTLLGWETTFWHVASAIDDIPIARGSASAANDLGWEIITPNRLKLGRNNYRQLEGPMKLDNCPQSQLERNRLLTSRWYEIFIERLHLLVPSPSKQFGRKPLIGDVVLFVFTDPNTKKLWVWKLGVIEEKISRSTYSIRYCTSDGERKTIQRAAAQISIILPVDQLHIGQPGFLDQWGI